MRTDSRRHAHARARARARERRNQPSGGESRESDARGEGGLDAGGGGGHEGGGGEAEELERGERSGPGAGPLAEAGADHARGELRDAPGVVDLVLLLRAEHELPVAEYGLEVEVGADAGGDDGLRARDELPTDSRRARQTAVDAKIARRR